MTQIFPTQQFQLDLNNIPKYLLDFCKSEQHIEETLSKINSMFGPDSNFFNTKALGNTIIDSNKVIYSGYNFFIIRLIAEGLMIYSPEQKQFYPIINIQNSRIKKVFVREFHNILAKIMMTIIKDTEYNRSITHSADTFLSLMESPLLNKNKTNNK